MKSIKMALAAAVLAAWASPSITIHSNAYSRREAWQGQGKKPKPKQR